MKLAVYGATGWIGNIIVREALERGHTVTAIVRDPARLDVPADVHVVTGDATDQASVAEAVAGSDVVIGSITGRRDQNPQQVSTAAQALLAGTSAAGVRRLIWIGGAGSLQAGPNARVIDSPEFPKEYLAEATEQVRILDTLRNADTDVDWTVITPAIIIAPGKRTGTYTLGGDSVITNANGESWVSAEDFVVALLDEAEQANHLRQRFTVVS